MSRHYHDPYRPHAARPVEDPYPTPEPTVVSPVQTPSTLDPDAGSQGVTEEVVSDGPVEPESPAIEPEDVGTPQPVDEDPVVPPMDPPPQVGPGSSADAWRVYAAEVTGTPPETWAESTRTVVIQVLREQGYAVDQSGVPGS